LSGYSKIMKIISISYGKVSEHIYFTGSREKSLLKAKNFMV
jgi:hypothetical protein